MKKKLTILGTLLLAVVISGYSVSGTYAKYTSSIDLSDEARVAKWQIKMDQDTMNELNLFEDSYFYGDDNHLTVNSIADADGKKANVVAPGTHGQYTFALTGEIETNYTIDVKATGKNTVVLTDGAGNITYDPMKFYLDTNDALGFDNITGWYDFQGLLDALNALYSADGTVYGPGSVDNTSYTIYWKWDFTTSDANDLLDTQLGETSAEHIISLGINITANQTQAKATA